MTTTNLTAAIAGTIYPVLNTQYKLDDKVDERSGLVVTILDSNASYAFTFGQPVTITDTLEGNRYTGFVSDAQAVKYAANVALSWQLTCVDNEFLAGKKSCSRTITNQFAGIAAASMVNDFLSADGIVANYALRDDNSQSDFNQGTLSGTQATSNLGGDLELAPAGSQVNILENTSGVFGSGSLNNCQVSGNSLIPTPTSSIKLQGTESLTQDGNAYTYVQIFQGGGIAIVSGRYLAYDVWVDPASPTGQVGVDIVFTDGSTLRDNTGTTYLYNDAQNIPPHPNHDIGGFAKGTWYHRSFLLDNFTGKTIAFLTVVLEGNAQGTYTAYFKNIYEVNSSNTIINTFFNGTFGVNPPKQMQNSGYSNVSCTLVNTYDCITQATNRVSPSYPIGNANIINSSFITWIATQQTNTNVLVEYSLDGGNSYITCTNNVALPSLLAGLSVGSLSIQFRQTFQQLKGASPESQPMLSSMQALLNPSYVATKSDVTLSATTNTQWNAGTLTNTQVNSGVLSLFGAIRNFLNTDLSGFTIFGDSATGPGPTTVRQHCNLGTLWDEVGISMEGRSRIDLAGTWGDACVECDIYIDRTDAKPGLVYRTTGWSNWDSNYAYAIECTLTSITLQKGSNSSASSTGTRTQVATATISIASASWHRLKVIFSGSSHQIFIDEVRYINVTDGTYTAAGNIGFRASNANASQGYQGQFNNFGITVTGLSGTWLSPSTSLTSAGTYGGSVVSWEDVSIGGGTSILVESTINGGSTFQTVTNGGSIPNLTLGQSLSGVSVQFRVTLSTQSASSMPQIQYFVARVLGGFSSSGTRIAPFLDLSNAVIAGSTLSAWTVNQPANTSITVATSTDGVSYTTASNGGSIAGITAQPAPTLDTFSTNTSPSYTSTNRTGGATGAWFWDSVASRLSVAGGTNALLLFSGVSCKDVDMILDLDQADCAGLVWRQTDASNYYELDIFDASSNAGSTNVMRLYKVVSNVKTQIGSDGAIVFTRGIKYRVRVVMIGTAITVSLDGVTILSQTDASLAGPGSVGISEVSGIGRFYNFRVQPQGDNLNGKIVYSKVTLTSTDPTATPQLTDLMVAALHPNIGLGSLIPSVTYDATDIASNIKDLAKKSDYTTYIDQNFNFIFAARTAQPAPWILQSSDQQLLLDGPLTVDYNGDLYRNRMTLKGVIGTATDSKTKTGDGVTRSWVLGAGNLTAPPTVFLNGNPQTIGVKGIDTGKNFYWSPDTNVVEQDASGNLLQQTDTISFQNYTYQFITSFSVDNTNLANTVTQKQFAGVMGRSVASRTVLTMASGAHTVSGDRGDMDVSNVRRIAIDINITAVSGSSPSIQFFIDRKGADGAYYQIWQSSSTGTTGQVSASIGAFTANNQALGAAVRFRWVITGSTPSFTFSASIQGQMDVQSAGFGVVEVVEDVSSQSLNVAAATAYAIILLTRYGTTGRTLTFKTWRRNPSLAIGQYLPVFIPEHNINDASMLITAIETTQQIAYENGVPSQEYFQAVTASENANIGSAWQLLASTLK